MARTYADAVSALNTLQSNFAVIEAIRKSGGALNSQAIPEMIEWARRIGYEPSDFDRLNLIHIAGTKGKGSTSAFISSILSQHISSSPTNGSGVGAAPKSLQKVGLYTSPHLRFVRERIQINNEPLSESQFARYFFEVWDRFEASARKDGRSTDKTAKPVYFRYLTLMAFHTYVSEGVDAAVIECGIGGEYDSTNIIVNPIVTGISSLGIDHTAVLGGTIEEIAWHKAGIMKNGAAAFSVRQHVGAEKVLKERAKEKKIDLSMVDIQPEVANGTVQLGLDADFQKINASLAVAVAGEWLRRKGYDCEKESKMDEKTKKGLREVRWGGRCETREEGSITWYIDGGHTLESIELVGRWFSAQIQTRSKHKPRHVLIFNQQARDASALAKALHSTLTSALKDNKPFERVLFCTNTTFKEAGFRPDLINAMTAAGHVEDLRVQKALASTWAEINPGTEVSVVRTIEEAVNLVRVMAGQDAERQVMSLVTGSLHLVGGFLEVLDSGQQ